MRFIMIICMIFTFNLLNAKDDTTSKFYTSTLDQLFNWEISDKNVFKVDSISFSKDVGKFILKEGKIYLLPEINGRNVGFVFSGEGHFSMTPPTKIEQENLNRFIESKTCDEEFDNLFIFFADTSFTTILNNLPQGQATIFEQREANAFIRKIIKDLGEESSYYFQPEMLRTIFNNLVNDYFYAYVDKGFLRNDLSFQISPYNDEEVSLSRGRDIISMFHKADEYQNTTHPPVIDKDEIKLIHMNLNCTIEDNMDFSASAECEIKADMPVEWFRLFIYYKMEVDSAFWSDGTPVEYFKGEENGHMWIMVPEGGMEPNEKRKITFYYQSEDLLKKYKNWITIHSHHFWRPVYDGLNQCTTYDIYFKSPDYFDFICVGEQTKYEKKDGFIFSHWIVNNPTRNISFNIGWFKKHDIDNERVPPISVLMSKSGHRGPEIAFIYGSGKDMEKQVGVDILNSSLLFQSIFGPLEIPHLYASEYPRFWSGEAFPGLINLGWRTFQNTHKDGYDEILRAHEVAHQWWGIMVDFESYHDQWLSEGISEFCALWYFHTINEDKSKYISILDDYKKWILRNRKYIFGDGQEAGPIWLGYRNSSTTTAGDYGMIVYRKAAWVFQMLRVMMLDLRSMNEDPFKAMLRDVYQSYKGRKINTENFKKIVEKHMRIPMDWFFNQWIYDIDIPTYQYAYLCVEEPDGRYKVTLKVKQLNVPGDFQMYVPIKIELDNDRFARLKVHVNKPITTIQLPLIPEEPEEIIFNDLNGVLAEVEEVDWDEIE